MEASHFLLTSRLPCTRPASVSQQNRRHFNAGAAPPFRFNHQLKNQSSSPQLKPAQHSSLYPSPLTASTPTPPLPRPAQA